MQAMKSDQDGIVAIVDDDPAILDSLKFLLELFGHKVETYGSAAALLDNLEHLRVCGIILDHHMPQMTGLELVARLRAKNADIPVLLITGSSSPAIAERAAQLGITMLEKPPEERDLLAFLSTHC